MSINMASVGRLFWLLCCTLKSEKSCPRTGLKAHQGDYSKSFSCKRSVKTKNWQGRQDYADFKSKEMRTFLLKSPRGNVTWAPARDDPASLQILGFIWFICNMYCTEDFCERLGSFTLPWRSYNGIIGNTWSRPSKQLILDRINQFRLWGHSASPGPLVHLEISHCTESPHPQCTQTLLCSLKCLGSFFQRVSSNSCTGNGIYTLTRDAGILEMGHPFLLPWGVKLMGTLEAV